MCNMLRRFTPKHQRIILQCYPPGRGTDKKPNSSELSYLLYYASTRRTKLEKVGAFLEKKALTDCYKSRTGNVQVTLDILHALIEKCPDNVDVFAPNLIRIIDAVLKTKDLSLCQYALPLFRSFCSTIQRDIFVGDASFVTSFRIVCDLFLSVGDRQFAAKSAGPHAVQWQLVALDACRSISHVLRYLDELGPILLAQIVPFVLNCVSSYQFAPRRPAAAHTPLADTSALRDATLEHLGVQVSDGTERDASAVSDVTPIMSARSDVSAEKAAELAARQLRSDTRLLTGSEESVELQAMRTLRHFFASDVPTQVSLTTDSVMQFVFTHECPVKWSTTLILLAARWVPVQLRYLVLSSLVAQVPSTESVAAKCETLVVISALLQSPTTIMGLSVIDVLRELLDYQTRIVLAAATDRPEVPPQHVDHVVRLVSDVIANLSMHIYYFDQVRDMVAELVAKAAGRGLGTRPESAEKYEHEGSVFGSSIHSGDSDSRPGDTAGLRDPQYELYAPSVLSNIPKVLRVSARQKSGIPRSKCDLDCWDGSFFLLKSENKAVRTTFAAVFTEFIELEFLQPAERPTEDPRRVLAGADGNSAQIATAVAAVCQSLLDPSLPRNEYPLYVRLVAALQRAFPVATIVRGLPLILGVEAAALRAFGFSRITFADSGSVDPKNGFSTPKLTALLSFVFAFVYRAVFTIPLPGMQEWCRNELRKRLEAHAWYAAFPVPDGSEIEAAEADETEEINGGTSTDQPVHPLNSVSPINTALLQEQLEAQWQISTTVARSLTAPVDFSSDNSSLVSDSVGNTSIGRSLLLPVLQESSDNLAKTAASFEGYSAALLAKPRLRIISSASLLSVAHSFGQEAPNSAADNHPGIGDLRGAAVGAVGRPVVTSTSCKAKKSDLSSLLVELAVNDAGITGSTGREAGYFTR